MTSAASGFGCALTEYLANNHYRVLGTYYHSEGSAEALVKKFSGQVHMIQADLSKAEDRARVVTYARHNGGLWGLINNLGVYSETWIENIDTVMFEQIFGLTCTVCFDLIQRTTSLIRHEVDRGSGIGRIINIGDSGADRIEARAQATPYHIAKLGVHVLTRTFAQRLGAYGITVNMVSPGFMENSVGEPGESIPLGGPTRFADVLHAVGYLLQPESRHVSGTNLLVGGAWNLG
ncbi:MAG: SDR family oxidoreductase [Myxococcales bacterium]|nr:SDR family oxidoreductase [Myxococcales bacterium]